MLAVLASVAALAAARDFFVPVLLALLVATALSPVVTWGARLVPVWASAGVVMLALVTGLSATAYTLSDEAVEISQQLPAVIREVRRAILSASPRNGLVNRLQDAVSEFQRTTDHASTGTPVTIVEPVNVQRGLLMGAWTAVSWSSQALLLGFFVFVVLSAGDLFRLKLVQVSGERLSRRKVTVQMIDEMTGQVRSFLFYQAWSGALVGAVTAAALAALGLHHPILWGLLAGVLNGVPYVGPTFVMLASAVAALVQFRSVGMAVAVSVVSVVVTSLEGMLLSPFVLGRTARINTVAVFLALIFWTWLWGAAGLILAVPLLMVLKSVSARLEALRPLDVLLGDD